MSNLEKQSTEPTIDQATARQIMLDNRLLLDISDRRTAQEYVAELLTYIEAEELRQGEESLAHELARFACQPIGVTIEPVTETIWSSSHYLAQV